jgi:hypothetical protein
MFKNFLQSDVEENRTHSGFAETIKYRSYNNISSGIGYHFSALEHPICCTSLTLLKRYVSNDIQQAL